MTEKKMARKLKRMDRFFFQPRICTRSVFLYKRFGTNNKFLDQSFLKNSYIAAKANEDIRKVVAATHLCSDAKEPTPQTARFYDRKICMIWTLTAGGFSKQRCNNLF